MEVLTVCLQSAAPLAVARIDHYAKGILANATKAGQVSTAMSVRRIKRVTP